MKPKRKTQEQMLMDNPIAASIFRKQIADCRRRPVAVRCCLCRRCLQAP